MYALKVKDLGAQCGFYIHEIRGVCYLTYVRKSQTNSLLFANENHARQWAETLKSMGEGVEFEPVKVSDEI